LAEAICACTFETYALHGFAGQNEIAAARAILTVDAGSTNPPPCLDALGDAASRGWTVKWLRSLGIGNSRPAFILALTMVTMLVLSLSAAAQNQYYVAPFGSDSNNGTSPGAPWKTIRHAIASFSAGTSGAVINVSSGTYTEAAPCAGNTPVVCVNRGGSSTTQRLVLKCTTQWSVPSGSGCLLRNNGGTNGAIEIIANNVDVNGFDYSNAGGGFGIFAYCNGTTSGQCVAGNSVHIVNNYMHDIGQTVVDGLGGPGCPSAGGILAGPRHGTTAFQTDLQVIGNRVSNFGLQSKAPRNGGSCNFAHGIYISNPGSVVENNVVVQAITYGIQFYSYPCNGVISNNTVMLSGKGGIVVGGGDCNPQGKITIINNILGDAPSGGITLGAGGTAPCTNTSRIKISNNLFASSSNQISGNLNGCTDVSGSLVEAPIKTFTGYLGTANDHYQLRAGSLAIGRGTTSCTNGVISCVNAIDIAGLRRSSPPSIGSYEFGSTSSDLSAPTGLTAVVQ
jgi:hypothetical protein